MSTSKSTYKFFTLHKLELLVHVVTFFVRKLNRGGVRLDPRLCFGIHYFFYLHISFLVDEE